MVFQREYSKLGFSCTFFIVASSLCAGAGNITCSDDREEGSHTKTLRTVLNDIDDDGKLLQIVEFLALDLSKEVLVDKTTETRFSVGMAREIMTSEALLRIECQTNRLVFYWFEGEFKPMELDGLVSRGFAREQAERFLDIVGESVTFKESDFKQGTSGWEARAFHTYKGIPYAHSAVHIGIVPTDGQIGSYSSGPVIPPVCEVPALSKDQAAEKARQYALGEFFSGKEVEVSVRPENIVAAIVFTRFLPRQLFGENDSEADMSARIVWWTYVENNEKARLSVLIDWETGEVLDSIY